MIYSIEFSNRALADLELHKKSGNKVLLAKLQKLIQELSVHPRTGTGQVEQLKHCTYPETWSRRINQKHRLIYEIHDLTIIVKVISLYGHYSDK